MKQHSCPKIEKIKKVEKTFVKNNYENPSITHISNLQVFNLIKNFKNSEEDMENIYIKLFELVYLDKNVPENFCISMINDTMLNIYSDNKINIVTSFELGFNFFLV